MKDKPKPTSVLYQHNYLVILSRGIILLPSEVTEVKNVLASDLLSTEDMIILIASLNAESVQLECETDYVEKGWMAKIVRPSMSGGEDDVYYQWNISNLQNVKPLELLKEYQKVKKLFKNKDR